MITQPSQQTGWRKILRDLNLTASSCEPPPSRTTNDAEASETTWLQALACFARTGFLRVLIGETPTNLELYVQIAAGAALKSPELLTAALATYTQTPWTTQVSIAPFELSTKIPNTDELTEATHSPLRDVLVVLMKLGDLISSNSAELTHDSITTALSFTPPVPENKTPTPQHEDSAPQENVLFETIGVSSSVESSAAPNIDRYEVTQHDNHIEIALHLTALLRPSEHIELARALAHHLRARFDADVLPAPGPVAPTTPSVKTSTIRLNAESSEEDQRTPAGRAELAKSFTSFFKKAQEWAVLGIDIFELVGLKHKNSTPDMIPFTATQTAPKTTQVLSKSDHSPPKTSVTENSDDIVFDLSSRSTGKTNADTPSTLGLSPPQSDALVRGHFTDERLKRDDATTPLVDLVLRHPGYSDRRIGQVLSIMLSIDYSAALRLAENAPCVIAWGLAQQTASNYKDVIETTGGKALLVEPDTFRER